MLVIVAEFAASAEEIRKMRPWQKRRLLKKGRNFFKECGTDAVAMSLPCREAFGEAVGDTTLQVAVEPKAMPRAIRYALQDISGVPSGKMAWFYDRNCAYLELSLLAEVGRRVQYLGLITKAWERAAALEEALCEEFGINLEIEGPDFIVPDSAALIANFDEGYVKASDTLRIDGEEVSLDLREYLVDLQDLLVEFPAFSEKLSHRSWLNGKKRLTR